MATTPVRDDLLKLTERWMAWLEARIGAAPGDFVETYDPAHPAADARGYVKRPNVDSLVEIMDMREAQRSYSANVSVLEVTRGMLTRIIETLR